MAAAALLNSAPEEGMALLGAQAAARVVELGGLRSAAQSAGRGGNSAAGTTATAAFEAAVDTFMPGTAPFIPLSPTCPPAFL